MTKSKTSKHIVYCDMDDGSRRYYNGYPMRLRGESGPRDDFCWNENRTDATPLTQRQAKTLIDSLRNRRIFPKADPSFTITY